MKEQLRQIYAELSSGQLSRKEGLEKIKAIKQQEQLPGGGVLFARPVWQPAGGDGSARIESMEHHVVLCELPAVDGARLESLLPRSLCMAPRVPSPASLAQRYSEMALACFGRIRTVLQAKPHGKVLIQIVIADDALAGLAGLLKTAALENPQIIGQLIHVSADTSAEELSRLLEDEKRRVPDPEIRHAPNGREVLRWEEIASDPVQPPVAFKDHGVYLITGGLGGLGILFAREILGRTSEARVVLTGRAALTAEKRALLDELSAKTGSVSYRQLDLGDADQVKQLIAAIENEYGHLDGILHGAGMLADNFILKKTAAELTEVLAPKVTGTIQLDEATRDVVLDFFVLFSSVVGAMGNVGQADYAAANGFMDQFAARRNRHVAAGQRHGRTRSINWPLWQDGGMGTDPASRELLQQATGIQPMQTATGMDAFHRALAWPYDEVLVAEGDPVQIRRALNSGRPIGPEPSAAPVIAVDGDSLVEKTEGYLRRECSELLKLPFQAIDPQAALEKYGIDSILAMKLTGQLEKTFGTLSKTLFFEYQTIRELAGYFAQSHAVRLAALFPQAESVVPQSEPLPFAPGKRTSRRFSRRTSDAPARTTDESIAIVGLSGRYPESVDVDAYWENLRDGKDCIVEVPKSRWDWREYFSDDRTETGRHYSKWGGFISGVDEFDPLFFNISPKEAKQIDPQERLFLQHAWMAIEDAGYTRASLQLPSVDDLPGQVGVYVGVMYTEYQLFGAEAGARGLRMGVASSGASISNRVSYALNLHGPSVTLDTMCSSSLTAIHFACLDLKLGRTNLAIAGGVNVSIHPNKYLYLSAGQFISGDGHCQSFGEGGDGYIPGEGVGVVVLKRLSEAERDGDHIYGVIRGSALNHGGKTNGYTVPNPQAQATVIGRALADAGIDARHISYIEAHGTGTKLGDPIEITALGKAFGRHTDDTGFCLIGSAKSNIGHCESAAAIAGLTKVLLQMKHRQLAPSLHSARLNPHIDFARSPFVVNQSLRAWEQPVVDGRTLPRIAGISSFGAGGSNAHLIVEEYPEQASPAMNAGPVAIVLSARTPEQLEQKARDLGAYVRAHLGTVDLASMAYTLQVGREPMDERLGFVVSSAGQLAEKLEAYLSGRAIDDTFTGQVKRNKEALSVISGEPELLQTIDNWIAGRKLPKLVDLWVKGLELDWTKMYAGTTPRRMSLPTYPFAKEHYWVEIPAAGPAAPKSVATAVLHPLLHTNTSDLDRQSYGSTFTGEEPFLNGRVLPAAAYLEMARAAVEKAAHPPVDAVIELRDVVWAQPVVVGAAKKQVHIALLANDADHIDYEIYSQDADEEIVHCQGRAVLSRGQGTPTMLDLEQLRARGEFLVQLPDITAEDYVLHPTLVHAAWQAATGWVGGEQPFAVQSLRIVSRCASGMVAWVRRASGDDLRLDIDLCDLRGNVAMQMRGVSCRPASVEITEPAVVAAPVRREIVLAATEPAPAKRKKPAILLSDPEDGGSTTHSARKAPVTLASPAPDAPAEDSSVRLYDDGNGIFSIEIAAPASAQVLQALERVQVEVSLKVLLLSGIEHLGGRELDRAIVSFPHPVIAVLQRHTVGAAFLTAALCDFMVCSEDATYGSTEAPAALLRERFGVAQSILTVSTGHELRAKGWMCPIVPAARVESHARELASKLATKPQDALRLLKQHLTRRMGGLVAEVVPAAKLETVAPEQVRVVGVSEMMAGRIDAPAVVLSIDDSEFTDDAVTDVQRAIAGLQIPVVAALTGNARGNAWLLAQFCDAAVYCRQGVYTAANVALGAASAFTRRFGIAAAREIVLTGAEVSGRDLQQRIGALTVVDRDQVLSTAVQVATSCARLPRIEQAPVVAEQADAIAESVTAPTPIALQSRVVTATAHPDGIVVVTMEDRDAKNMFSEAFVDGVREVFAHIENTPAYKVVVLTGYDSYFASGGTKEALLAIQQGRTKFTDANIFQLPLDCRLPVIAAVQGHGIGAGWCLGLFADVVLLSEESRYVSPYMNYGFTPGAGATYILPETLGEDLARESLLTGQTYTGRELRDAGVRLPILPRADVPARAMEVAKQIARVPRRRLIALKQQLTAQVHDLLEETYRLELEMHEKTFVGRSDTLAQIEMNFHQEADTTPAPQADVETADPRVDGDLLEVVTAALKTLLAKELQMRESDIDDNAQFVDLGLDSIGGVSWIRKINDQYKTAIEATKIYSFPTLAQLSRHVREEAEQRGTLSAPAAPPVIAAAAPKLAPAPRSARTTRAAEKLTSWRNGRTSRFGAGTAPHKAEPIAVIGMAGQFPQANDLEQFWRNIAEGKNCITQVPRNRWDLDAFYQPGDAVAGKSNCQWLGALEGYDLFDPLFFNISPTEAENMDPQQRLFLQTCWQSIEHAGYDARVLSGSRCGVFVGCATTGDYHQVSREHQLSAQGFTGSATSILAARISYFLNLQGPCLSIDTACSSSLVALAQACDSLVSGDADLALAGGVCVVAGPDLHIKTSQAGMLSSEGKCFTFDQRADGFVPGEGVGVVMLKRLSDAERDGDVIYGLIQGWGVNQDGKTNGITAPNPESQTRLEQAVYDKYEIDPAGIQLIEAHGTGTKLGDPIEVEGLKNAFRKYTQNSEYCALGSVKSNIGHTLTAAGIAGVIKLLLALRHKQLPPTINFERLNEHIDLTGSPFYVNGRLQEWKVGGATKRQAAISSFGFSGTNAHMVVGEYVPPVEVKRVVPPGTKLIVPLSAKTAEQLRQKACDLLDFVRRQPSIDLADVAWTLQIGREAMDERLGVVVSSIEQLTEKLQAYVDGEREIRDFHQGQIKRGRESLSLITQDEDVRETIVDRWIAKKKLSKLLDLWVRGLELDWQRLHDGVRPRRIALPTYPFAKEHYWIDATASQLVVPGVSAALHPLLHTNTSDFGQQSYRSTFRGNEFFLVDHQVRTGDGVRKVLPGVAYLEMARAAIEHALHERSETTVLELRDTVWTRPVVVDGSRQIDIALLTDGDGEIEFEIYSEDGGEEVIHCQGRAILGSQPAPARLDLEQLRASAGDAQLEPGAVYAACARMGLLYGPTFQGIAALHRGGDQVLAQLRLPKSVAETTRDYVLHPSLMDSAVQSAIGLLGDLSALSSAPRLPFAVESLRVVWPCSSEMYAWVRYAKGSQATDAVVKLDIDLCDTEGNVCVTMRGFSLRVLNPELRAAGTLLATPVWEVSSQAAGNAEYAERHVVLCDLPDIETQECVVLRSEPRKTLAQRYSDYALASFERIQAILRSRPQGRVLVQIAVPDDSLSGLSALLETASLENPQFVGQLIVVPADVTGEELRRYLEAEKGRQDSLVRYDRTARQVLRWQEVAAEAETPVFKDRGVYLITGGLGSLGLLFAKDILAQTRDARIVVTGRSALTAEKRALLSDAMSYRQVNLGDLDDVEQLIASIQGEYGRLDGILHCAGMLADNFIVRKSAAELTDVLAPKVTGTYNLDRASSDVELDFFVFFSSFAAAKGNLGQSDYAAANGFMDRFAAYRNRQVAAGQRHGRTRSINWPLWQDGGMAIDPASRELLQEATGMQPMRTATGMQAFRRSLALPYDQIMVGEGDLARMRRALLENAGTAMPVAVEPAAIAIDSESFADRTQDYLRTEFSALLKMPAQNIDPQAALERYGIDSILALKLTAQLEKTFGSLSKTLLFEYQTIRDLAGYFIQSHAGRVASLFAPAAREVEPAALAPAPAPAEVEPTMRRRRFSRQRSAAPAIAPEADPIAIIGLSGRYPEAIDLEAYWENLRAGRDCIVEVPKERWDWREYFTEDRTQSGHHYSKWGGFISGVDEFDPLFFNISPKEAKSIDPQERLFLQHAWMAVEDAGYTRASLQIPSGNDLPGQVGVYVGLMYTEYQLFGVEASVRGNRMGMAGSAGSIANRVSYALNLHGPSMTLDTMCSSSLTAIHLACQDLKQGRTSLAIAGGVNVSIHPNKYLMLSAGQFISSDGHCQSFGEGGDGYIPGEGLGVVVLKRLSEAKRDGDHVYGVIRGSALNHGGKTNGYSVPNPQAQACAIGRALAESKIDARHVSYIEAHGTGTKLGDPIEIAALNKAFRESTQDTQFCLIGSAKSNIGHCESAAAIAGLTKVLLQMQHRQIAPSLHSAELNPHIDFETSPFTVNQELTPWEQPVVDGRTLPRIAGISSFGAGGSNAHLIVEEYQVPIGQPIAVTPVAIVLSARTPEQLQQKARGLSVFVRARRSSLDLPSVAYTLQAGREAMDERYGFIASSIEQLIETLDAFVAGGEGIEDSWRGQVRRGGESPSLFSTDPDLQQTVEQWIADRNLAKLLDLWVEGRELDWSKLYGEAKPRRISLPAYPFARDRYWIDVAPVAPVVARGAATAFLHPLLHSNTSDMNEQRYSSTFAGDEAFLADERLRASAYLEMARAAIEHAVPERPAPFLELRDVAWSQAIAVSGKQRISIALFASANGSDEVEYEIYGEDQAVHCQGRAVVCGESPARLDLAALRPSLTAVRPTGAVEDYVLDPSLLAGAMPGRLVALDSIRIFAACTKEMFAWVRPSSDDAKVDVDLCDDQGNVCAQLRGVSLRTDQPIAVRAALTPKEVAFIPLQPALPARTERKKPSAIALAAPDAALAERQTAATKPSVTLSDAAEQPSEASSVRLSDHGDGMFAIRLDGPAAIAELQQALDQVRQDASIKVLTITGAEHCFARAERGAVDEAIEQRLYETVASLPSPVIGVLQGETIGAGFLFAALCDFMVCSEDARYGFNVDPTAAEFLLFSERFGDVRAHDLLYMSPVSTGRELRAKGWTLPIVPAAQVESSARELASSLASKSRDALLLLKSHLTRPLPALVAGLTRAEIVADDPSETPGDPTISPLRHLRLDVPEDDVLVITVLADDEEVELDDLVADLGDIFARIRTSACKAIVLASEYPQFLPADVALDVQRLVEQSEIPVVAALAGDARGNAWLTAQFCHAVVYSRQGIYSAAGIGQTAPAVFAHRFGYAAAREILLTGADYSGSALQQRVGALTVADHDQVLSTAVRVAASWTRMASTTLAAWTKETAATIESRICDLEVGWEQNGETGAPLSAGPVALRSRVVTATAHPGGIVVVELADREAKNMFSDALMHGVTEVFEHIAQTPSYKVVVLTGYDHYFASGGTKESLLAIQAGTARFTDSKIFQAALDCKLPVIAAMQGHGIGAGWSLGMFADVVLLGEESRYVSPYMDYGFTPGAGATWSLPDKMGQDLARESLLTARSYTGSALKSRGLLLRILPRADVHATAMALAQQIAQASRGYLIELKQQLTAYVSEPLAETLRAELAMHEKTFVGRSDTLAQIEANFDQPAHRPAHQPGTPVPATNPDDLPVVAAALKTLLANELLMQERDIDDNAQFVDLGLDSISGVSWIRKVNEKYQTSIEATKVYSFPTLAQLSRHVKAEAEARGTLSATVAPAPVETPVKITVPRPVVAGGSPPLTSKRSRKGSRAVAATPAPRTAEIAIVGMAGQFPRANDLDEFWQNIAEGRNCISEVPSDRWDVNVHYQAGDVVPGKTNSRWVGALEEYDLFDPLFFNISPTEAELMDPQQRLFLQACWHSIENAGYDARVLSGSRCGVFVGCATGDYHQISRAHQLTAQGFTGTATSILAARISYFLNLVGPCVSIDTACSSSLVAIAQACDSLIARDSDLALAGGVYVMAGPEMHIRTAQAGMLSSAGRCYTFDQRANGFVAGEGVGVIVLKRLADAQRDGDIIHGVIEGWGVNQDGRTNGITAPNPESQTRLELDVYEKYRIDPANIQLLEAHGTATKLGDPIEVEGLKAAFGRYTQKKDYCAIGSVKSNIGHTLTAAGIAGTIKLLLALKHRQLPPTIHFERLNEHIELDGSPFYVNTKLQEWELRGATRRQAAISSFGFSGTNGHIVIGEYVPPVQAARSVPVVTPHAKTIVPLSARTPEQLRDKARDLLHFLRETPALDLGDVAYTLQAGRSAMEERLVFIITSVEQLAGKLQAYVDGAQGIDDVYQGGVRRGKESLSLFTLDAELQETIDKWIANRKLSRLADLWVRGLDLDWNKFYPEIRPARISLPLYPFAKERYWIDAGDPVAIANAPAAVDSLLHSDTSDLTEHHSKSTLTGEELPAAGLLASPGWASSELPSVHNEYAEHHVVLCELEVDVPNSVSLQASQKDVAQRYSEYAVGCFEHIQAILQSKPRNEVLVQIVVADDRERALFAGLSGLLKTAALENPKVVGQLILVGPDVTSEELNGLLQAEKNRGLDPVIRYERGARQVLRWNELPKEQPKPQIAFRDQGVYLITGGTGGLGTLFAKEILEHTRQARVVVTGRSDSIAETHPRVSYRQLDLADLDQVRSLIAGIGNEYGQLNGVFHAAGMTADNVIRKKTSAELTKVLAPKVTGLYNLDQATLGVELDFFILFSSIAAVTGNFGQADYAAANAFMDQFAAYRNRLVAAKQRHGRTRSINWSLWQDGGMAIDAASRELVQQTTGIHPMQTATGLQAFYRSLALPHDQLLVVEGVQPKLTAYLQRARVFEPAAVTETIVRATEPAFSIDELQQHIRTVLSSVLRIEASRIDLDQPFAELGLDSFLGAELVVAMNRKYGTGLSHIELFDHATVRQLALLLEQETRKLPARTTKSAPPVVDAVAPAIALGKQTHNDGRTSREQSDGRIAIIGMSGRYPKASDLDQYWENLAEGRNAISVVPAERWDVNRYYDPDRSKPGKTNSKWLGALDDIDCFDPLFFRISPKEAESIDPQHRLFLQESYRAFEDAGYSLTTLSNRKCGVYLGISTNEYLAILSRAGALSVPVTSNSYAIAAARIAYYLNLKGPAISVDTACSSALVAVHLACQAIVNGEIDMALAGGVSLWLTPESYLAMSGAGMFSADGQCKTFDDSADGIVNGEGVGAVVLKRLSDAQRDGDFIHGVILGSGINQDGKTNGITAPSVSSQIDLARGIYARHDIDPATISYIEAHGTGTKLGDPIELEALKTVFSEKTSKKNFCALGSVKSNIGHTTSAAGVAGLQKVLLSMRHRTLVPTLHVTKESSRFDFASSPFYVSRERQAWHVAPGTLRRAAVSSFGFSGTNAHLVVEEYPAGETVPRAEAGTFIVPLSARTAAQLLQRADDLLSFLRAAQHPIDLAAVAWTLQIGREAMAERLGFVVGSVEELIEKLSAYVGGEENIEGAHFGRIEPGSDGMALIGRDLDTKEAIDGWIAQKDLPKLLDLWVHGLSLDWNRLHDGPKPRRVSLPAYPFAKERCWVTGTLEAGPADNVDPDLDMNTIEESIEDIIRQIDDDAIETELAIEALRMLV